jgi:1-acyl-sn-glycerol-3-phosphate acyltransferase
MSRTDERLGRKTWVYHLCWIASWLGLHLLWRLRVDGRENLPAEGGVMLVCNHQSFLDIPLVAASTRRHVCFVARESLARSRFLAFIMRGCGAILVQRGNPSHRVLREIEAHLRQGDCVAVFPEGTRSPDGRVRAFRQGAVLAARRVGVPLVPAGIRGAIEVLPRDRKLPRLRRVSIRYGSPIDPEAPEALETAREAVVAMVGDGRYAPEIPGK